MHASPAALLEAILFSSGESLSKTRLATLLGLSPEELRSAAIELRDRLAGTGLALMEAGEDLELRTIPEAAAMIHKLRESELSRDLGKASLETLAIVMYKNGATRSEIDWIRGVNSAAALRALQMRGLVERTEDATDRRKIRYITTIDALAHLGVSQLTDLPHYSELTVSLSENIAKDQTHETE